MKTFLQLKSKLKEFYEKNYAIVRPLLKFVIALILFLMINQSLGYLDTGIMFVISLLIAFVCSLIPDTAIVYFGTAMAVAQVMATSLILGVALFFIVVIVFLMLGRYAKELCYVIIGVPVFGALHLAYLVPVVAGLFFSPIVLPAIILGVFFKFVMTAIQLVLSTPVTSSQLGGTLGVYRNVVDSVASNKIMILWMIAFVVCYMVTYLLRRRKNNYASQVAILVGNFVMIVILLIGNIIVDAGIDVIQVVVCILICLGIAYIIQFFRMTLDYTGVKNIQLEDDEYYYYVKAVPKLKIAQEEKTLKTINPKGDAEDTVGMENLQKEFDKVLKEENK